MEECTCYDDEDRICDYCKIEREVIPRELKIRCATDIFIASLASGKLNLLEMEPSEISLLSIRSSDSVYEMIMRMTDKPWRII